MVVFSSTEDSVMRMSEGFVDGLEVQIEVKHVDGYVVVILGESVLIPPIEPDAALTFAARLEQAAEMAKEVTANE